MTNKEIGLKKIQELVTRFSEQLDAYKKSDYNETQTRRDFIDPFFKALGWDIDNEQGFAESYREVIHEDRVKVGTATKAPDYSFRLSGGQRLFFVEAKKPSVLIKDDIQPAYQVRRYGWSAKLSVSVITDFEEFAIYDCTKKPIPTDKTSVARVKYITYNDYITEWDFLWNTFSKEAVLKGSFDKFIGGNANKKGTATVDKEFLNSLDQWRTLLAETISKENKQLDEDELNFVVQQTLDRIIFLRICEDRSIEPYGKLKECLNRGDFYQNLLLEFKQADDKYNSGLFNFKKDKLSHQLKINNKTVKTIISQLYYPECPYEFSVLSVEILGSAYEQFLGKTITINNRGKAVIELKPEVRKAGGVYYTPQYIVDYIVSNTIGKLCEKKTPTQVAEIKIVDPACGSGSFLLGAYQYLLNWHKDYYLQNPNKKNPISPEGNLTTPAKKKILLNNIYGVDIDTNAVEVTKLSLLLKCMEGETQASIAHQMKMFSERVLPTLEDNIKSGNSLIDTDYYDTQLDFGEERKIKPFSWQKAYPTVFKKGGFDVVIGNPPYVEFKQLDNIFKKYLEIKYSSAKGKYDLYIPFIEKAINLLNENGYTSFIVPSMFTKRDYGKEIRKYITEKSQIDHLIYFGDFQVFDGVTVFPFVFIFKKGSKLNETKITLIPTQKKLTHAIISATINNKNSDVNSLKYKLNSKDFHETPWVITDRSITNLKNKIDNLDNVIPLKEITEYIFVGIQTGKDEVFYVKENDIEKYNLEKSIVIPILKGKDVNKYRVNWGGTYCIYPYNKNTNKVIQEKELKQDYPNVYNYLVEKKDLLKGRSYFDNSSKLWYELWCERNFLKFQQKKIINAEISDNNRFYLDESGFLGNTKTFSTVLINDWAAHYYFVLGVLNSKTLEFYHKQISVPKAGGFFEYKTQFINQYPIPKINFMNKLQVDNYNIISQNAKHIIQLEKELQTTKLESKKEQVKQKIEYKEDKINELVYQLYDLKKEEIELVESN
jgi:hypothetical protein